MEPGRVPVYGQPMRWLIVVMLVCGCGDRSEPIDAALPSCEGLCPPSTFCNAAGVCTCTAPDAGQVQCYRPPPQ